MTNQLFRDYLDGKIPARAKPKPPTLGEVAQRFAEAIGEPIRNVIGIFTKIAEAFTGADQQSSYTLAPPISTPQTMHGNTISPIIYDETNPRAQALAAKQRQGHGPPSSGSWRVRERSTKFRSQS